MAEWISVKDRMPKYNQTVLVYRPTMAEKILADSYYGYYGEDDCEWHEGWTRFGVDTKGNDVITHWRELPEPPRTPKERGGRVEST